MSSRKEYTKKAQKNYYERERDKRRKLKELGLCNTVRTEKMCESQKKYMKQYIENNREKMNDNMRRYRNLEKAKNLQLSRKSKLLKEMQNTFLPVE